jgi:hypothetical protein
MKADKEPKRWECTSCSLVSNKFKKQKFPGITFAVCFDCQGRIKESDDWLAWHKRMIERTMPAMMSRFT